MVNRLGILLRNATCLVTVISIAGCATAPIKKVPADPAAAEKMNGVRFYMNRPYVAVYKPIPLESRSYLVDGVVSPDGKFIRITGDMSALKGELPHAADKLFQGIPTSAVLEGATNPTAQGATPPAQPKPPAPPGAPAQPSRSSTPSGSGQQSSPTGTSNFTVTTELDSIGHFPFRDYFDIVFLPDFEEQYVIDPQGNFGDLSAAVTLGPGQMMTGLNVKIDNSVITRPLTDAYAELIKAGTEAAKAAINTAVGLPIAQGATIAQPATSTTRVSQAAGTPLTLRVHVVSFAAPGVYPILKKSEIDAAAKLPADQTSGYVLPIFPFTRVAYKTFQVIVVEQLLSDKTGGSALVAEAGPPPPVKGISLQDTPASTDALNLHLKGKGYQFVSFVDKSPADPNTPLTSATIVLKKSNPLAADQTAKQLQDFLQTVYTTKLTVQLE